MAFEFHNDWQRYFQIQYENCKTSMLPFIREVRPVNAQTSVLEIGCAEAGVLKAFLEEGCTCMGIELKEARLERAREFLKIYVDEGKLFFIAADIHDIDPEKDLPFKFDLIVLKDVIEHIFEQQKFLQKLHSFLQPNGKVFFGFPPWQMPFGGHQQICKSKILSSMPYLHLLPAPLYKNVLKSFNESEAHVQELLEIKETGISTSQFEKLADETGFKILKKEFYFISPIYSYKFHLKARKQIKLLSSIPALRDFFTTAAYYVIEKR